MFKDMRDLMKASKQFERPGLRESLSQANEMVQQVQQNQLLVQTGVDATATVVALRETGQYINEQPVIEMDLSVDRGGFVSNVTHRQAVSPILLPRVQVGASLPVKVDPNDTTRLVLVS